MSTTGNDLKVGFGWVPDVPDIRDIQFKTVVAPQKLPDKINYKNQCPKVYDQGQLGSCTANAIGGDLQFCLLKQKKPDFVPSRLFIYYNERVMENSVSEDAGAMIRDGIKSVNKQGACKEDIWPYDISKFTQKPSSKAYKDAKLHQALQYARIDHNIENMKGCLAEGFPFVYGFAVYDSFMKARDGNIPMPGSGERLLGGHAVLAVGYDDSIQRFIVRNSWGQNWGDGGYFTMPYLYMANPNLADDFWAIKLVEAR